jgi:hypothetical protein
MKRFYANGSVAIAAAVVLCGWALVMPARAAPPTVTPSPGYDARLQEQRAAAEMIRPPVPISRHHASRRHVKPPYGGVHRNAG